MFEVPISNPATGEHRSIVVRLSADEIQRSGGTDLYLHAFALRRAFRDMAAGFKSAPFFDDAVGATRRVRAVLVH